jgi:hypothetical protein
MRLYNLTDETPPYTALRRAQTLRIEGYEIEPGGHAELPDRIPLAQISGWVLDRMVSVDHVSTWYLQMKEARATSEPVQAETSDEDMPSSSVEATKVRRRGPKKSDG